MAANVTLPGTGSVIETIDLTGVERQSVTISDRAGGNVDSIGGLTETAPTTDTASSGLNGRLQRIAQRLSSMIALLPSALGAGGGLKIDGSGTSLPVTASAGTNLNTSALALETGGNLATVVTNTGRIPSQGQALAAASLPVVLTAAQITTLTPLTTVAATQSGTWNIGTVTTLPALVAGSALIGKVGIDQTTPGTTDSVSVKSQGFSAAVTSTRPANATPYTANDVVGATAAAWTFASMGPSAKEIMLTSVALEIDDTAIISGETSYRLYLYNVTPPSALADNAAFDLPSGDRASFLGYVDLGFPVDLGSTLYVETNVINKQLTLSGTSLFGYLVTNGAYTPSSARVYKITLHSVAV